jgi:hypothetical protein
MLAKDSKEALARDIMAQAHAFGFAGVAHRDRRAVVARYASRRYEILWEIAHGMGRRPAPRRAERLARHRLFEVQQALKEGRFTLEIVGGAPYLVFEGARGRPAYPVAVKGADA